MITEGRKRGYFSLATIAGLLLLGSLAARPAEARVDVGVSIGFPFPIPFVSISPGYGPGYYDRVGPSDYDYGPPPCHRRYYRRAYWDDGYYGGGYYGGGRAYYGGGRAYYYGGGGPRGYDRWGGHRGGHRRGRW